MEISRVGSIPHGYLVVQKKKKKKPLNQILKACLFALDHQYIKIEYMKIQSQINELYQSIIIKLSCE